MTTCPGTGRKWTGGTTARQVICPVCHRSATTLGHPKARRRETVPAHETRRP